MHFLQQENFKMFNYPQWVLWVAVPGKNGKTDKFPINYKTLKICDAHNSNMWASYLDAKKALSATKKLHHNQVAKGVGFVFTKNDPFFFIDLDSCYHKGKWSETANSFCSYFSGAFIEVSASGLGLHIIGSWSNPIPHGCRNGEMGLELYSHNRFIALSEINAYGNPSFDCTPTLHKIIDHYFQPTTQDIKTEWTYQPVNDWKGPIDDFELITIASKTGSAAGSFGYKATFNDLWNKNEKKLSKFFPDDCKGRSFDESRADAALAQHLAFWTGKNCERIQKLMLQSQLNREKWALRPNYLADTILKAVASQSEVFGSVTKLKARSNQQRIDATTIRSKILENCTPERRNFIETSPLTQTAKFWTDNAGATAEVIAKMIQPNTSVSTLQTVTSVVSGYQFMSVDLQLKHFKGCVYIQDIHKILTSTGELLNQDRFNASFGGYVFQLDEMGNKTTRKPWEAFTESQVIRHPKVNTSCFRPMLQPGEIISQGAYTAVNVYFPIHTLRIKGDASRFTRHLAAMLPNPIDQEIILSYLAACLQYPGKKFYWAPLIQGVEGNGKSLLTACIVYAIGEKYCHLPPANEITEKFNEWLFFKLFIGIEDIYVPESKREVIEVLKPMITGERLAMRAMQQSQVMADNVAHFIINSNWKDAVKKTSNDRRFAIFYCAQQAREDIESCGMGGDYFPNLYSWLRNENGFAIVSEYLHTYPINPKYNPATVCHRAPFTSSTEEAVNLSFGGVEQYIIEAVEEGIPGFCGGWISSVALDNLLSKMRKNNAIPLNKRKDVLASIGYHQHPGLTGGRTTVPILLDGGKKPRLYIKRGHKDGILKVPTDIISAYMKAQESIT